MIKVPFERLAPFGFLASADLDGQIKALEVFVSARRRTLALLKDRDFQHLRTRYRAAERQRIEIGASLYEEEVHHAHQANLRDILTSSPGGQDISRGHLAASYFILSDRLASWDRVSDKSADQMMQITCLPARMKKHADEALEAIWDIGKQVLRMAPPSARASIQCVLNIMENVSDPWRWTALLEIPVEPDLVDAALEEDTAAGPLGDSAFEESAIRVKVIRGRYVAAFDQCNGIADKLIPRTNTVFPLIELMDTTANPAIIALIHQALGNYRHLLCPELYVEISSAVSRNSHITDDVRLTPFLAPSYWAAVLNVLMASGNGMDKDGRFRPWVPALLSDLIYHPAKLRRAHVPDGGMHLKALLTKHVASVISAAMPDKLDKEIISIIAEKDVSVALQATGVIIASCLGFAIDESGIRARSPEQQKDLERTWNEVFTPNAEALLRRLYIDLRKARAAVTSGLFDIQDEPDTAAVAEELPAAPVAVPVEDPPELYVYVHNPASPSLGRQSVELSGDDRDEQFDRALKAWRVATMVKSSSILGALRHFGKMDQASRTILPTEETSAGNWYKLKRGRMRILLRPEDNHILFHIYPRNEWARNKILWRD